MRTGASSTSGPGRLASKASETPSCGWICRIRVLAAGEPVAAPNRRPGARLKPIATLVSRAAAPSTWPPAISRRVMLPPMRPSPMTPTCMAFVLDSSTQGAFDGARHLSQAGLDIAAQIEPQDAPAAVRQDREIAGRLRGLDDAEAQVADRHGDVVSRLGGDLQKHPGVGPALVGLAGGMQVTRPEAQDRGQMLAIANEASHLLQCGDVFGAAIQIGQQSDIVAIMGAAKMRRENGLDGGARRRLAQGVGVARIGK